ncbi:MAG: diacylglycerol kinase family lipid kinase [Bacteroidales bacterium]|nr:diacylglycerol kinase family lipid kinase [Bacteroidales bacterium]
MKKLLAVVNPKSGTGNQHQIPQLIDSIIDKSRFAVDIRLVEAEGDAYRFGREAVDNGYYGLVAIGGDGTVNGAASAVVNSDVALAVVPCGSGNGLGRHLNIPMDVKKALALINDDRVEPFDYCTVNDRPFMCTCGMGFDAQVAFDFSRAGKRGFITYLKKTFSVYANYKCEDYVLELDGERIEEKAFVIALCNAAQYGNNSFIAPHASMQDGMIDITVISPFKFYDAPLVGLSLFFKNIDKNRHVAIYRAKEIKIMRKQHGPMHIDGDPVEMPDELLVKCHKDGIRIFSPGLGENNTPE